MILKTLYIEVYYGEYSQIEIRRKINEIIEINENIQVDILVYLQQQSKNYESLLLNLIHISDPEFSHNCLEAEILAAEFFLRILYSYKDGNIEPIKLFKIFSALEAGFIDIPRTLSRNIAYYPKWMKSLYDAYDWCDKTWTIKNSTHLSNVIEHQIYIINDWLNISKQHYK